MNINFNNNIQGKKNPTILIISQPVDLYKGNNLPSFYKELFNNMVLFLINLTLYKIFFKLINNTDYPF